MHLSKLLLLLLLLLLYIYVSKKLLCLYLIFITVGTPVIKTAPQNQKFVRFGNVSFVCAAVGYPHPVIEWLKNSTVLRNSSFGVSNTKLLIISNDLGNCISTECGVNSTLWIFNTTKDDVGKYTCSVYNIAGNVSTTTQLIGNIKNILYTYLYQHTYLYTCMYVYMHDKCSIVT